MGKGREQKKKRTVIRPRPNRISEDFLTIVDDSLHNHNNDSSSGDNNSHESVEKSRSDDVSLPKAYTRKSISTKSTKALEEATSATSRYSQNQTPAEKFDLNTVWVEMLIHDEQR